MNELETTELYLQTEHALRMFYESVLDRIRVNACNGCSGLINPDKHESDCPYRVIASDGDYHTEQPQPPAAFNSYVKAITREAGNQMNPYPERPAVDDMSYDRTIYYYLAGTGRF